METKWIAHTDNAENALVLRIVSACVWVCSHFLSMPYSITVCPLYSCCVCVCALVCGDYSLVRLFQQVFICEMKRGETEGKWYRVLRWKLCLQVEDLTERNEKQATVCLEYLFWKKGKRFCQAYTVTITPCKSLIIINNFLQSCTRWTYNKIEISVFTCLVFYKQ